MNEFTLCNKYNVDGKAGLNEFDVSLPPEDVKRVRFLKDFLNFLSFLIKEKAPLTQTGNLNLKTIERISRFIDWPRKVEFGYVIRNETEWPYLEKIDILAQIMKLTINRKKHRCLTKYGKRFLGLLPTTQYSELFLAYWGKLNWAYLFPYVEEDRDNPACYLQDAQYFVVREMQEFKKDIDSWIDFQEFAEFLRSELSLKLLNYLGEDLPGRVQDCIRDVILNPLKLFNIVEFKYKKVKILEFEHDEIESFRFTPLGENILNIIALRYAG